MVNVLCMKWGTRYGPEYVNRLQAMVERNLSLPHRFVCMADNFDGLNPKVEALPLPELVLPPGAPDRGWRKLFSFMPKVGDLEGVTLFLDIDIVIIDKIDPFFEFPGEFCIIRTGLCRGDIRAIRRFTAIQSANIRMSWIISRRTKPRFAPVFGRSRDI